MKSPTALLEYPNASVRLRLARKGPGLPEREIFTSIWTKGTRFHVRDESGRNLAAILADILAPRSLGADPGSMEGMMDQYSQSLHPSKRTTELHGDLGNPEGVVHRTGEESWSVEMEKLAPIAAQFLAGEFKAPLQRQETCLRLGRTCTEYHGYIEGTEHGVPHQNEVTRIISPPYLMFSCVRDVTNSNHYYIREIISLQEGIVSNADLIP